MTNALRGRRQNTTSVNPSCPFASPQHQAMVRFKHHTVFSRQIDHVPSPINRDTALWRLLEVLEIRAARLEALENNTNPSSISNARPREYRSLGNCYRSLGNCVKALSRRITKLDKRDENHTSLSSRVAALGVRLSCLETKAEIIYEIRPDHYLKLQCAFCISKRRLYTRADRLQTHLLDTHPFLQPLFKQTVCYPCNKSYALSQNLVQHEKTKHDATYKSRIDIFWIYFIQDLSMLTWNRNLWPPILI